MASLMDILAMAAGAEGPKDWDAMARFGVLANRQNLSAVEGGHAQGMDMMSSLGGDLTNLLGANARANVTAQRQAAETDAERRFRQSEVDRKQSNFLMMFKSLIGDGGTPSALNTNTGFTEGGGMSPFMQAMTRMTGAGGPAGMSFGMSQSGPFPMIPIAPPVPPQGPPPGYPGAWSAPAWSQPAHA